MKSAIIHDWIYSISGAEKVLEAINLLFPSDIYTLIKNESNLSDTKLPIVDIKTSFIQRLPFAKERYPYYLPFYPKAIESFNLKNYEVIISSSSCAAKGVKKNSKQLHICYCHTPMRFLWDMCEDYLKIYHLEKGFKSTLAKVLFSKLRKWDIKTAHRVDYFIANSKHTANRIKQVYNREATVIYPPVDIDFYSQEEGTRQDYYVTVARFVPYKRIDLIIETFNNFPDKKLLILGQGPQKKKLLSLIKSKNIKLCGYVSNLELRRAVSRARAFIYMAHEDFGILPVEAQACGTPIIAYGKGGVLETTKEGITSVLFGNQTIADLKLAILKFEKIEKTFQANEIKSFASQFSRERFNLEFSSFVRTAYSKFKIKGE
jgi:glycosyltransferase involved in cell wall biosynthesis